ncbi:hypothetical protein [Ferrigenium sp. UT5]|uniref:hypothetical protein n=1 Tax=Ferrigenium sp. UT5 TaxID=3242105 RepID=UPI00354DC7CB
MAISPTHSGSQYVSQVQPQPQPYAERVAERENNKNSETVKRAAAVSEAPKPTVNTQGQTVGRVVNTQA